MAKNMSYFNPVDLHINFPKEEEKLLTDWSDKGIVEKYMSKNNASKKYFSFMDGPITANNPMGVHHAWGRTYKDLWQRYKNMQGYKQRFQNGFDCQGLWVEVEVEKELGLKSKKDIENLVPGDKKASIAKFVELCKARVMKYSQIQTDQSKRLGYFDDWDNSYYTLSNENNYMIWHFLKSCFERGLIYKGHESIPWCPRCETAISQHEMLTEDYKEVTHKAIYFALPITGRSNEYLLVWTTTPWTLPANIAVAVDKDLDYVLVKTIDGKKYWVVKGKDSLLGSDAKVIGEVKGKALVGLKYLGLFDELSKVKKVKSENPDTFHTVIATDPLLMPITTTEGTGLVHTAVSAGTEDFNLGKKLGLPMIPIIEDNADYMSDLDFLSGQNAKKHPEIILDYLQKKTTVDNPWVFKIENYTHRYPACWRCKTELVWKVADEWYISIDPVREAMKKVSKKIKWIPSFGLDRELDWLTNMHDWLISKKRYWGLALPIWDCSKCGHFEVMGSYDELKDRAVEGWDKFEDHTPHKPWVDEVKIKCEKCGAAMQRIPDVGNPWLDAGIVSFSTISRDNKSTPLYWTDKKEWQKWFPADFITESFPGQFKNWFYSLIAMSTVLENMEPAKVILGFGTLFAEDGKPMHKSWGNMINFGEGAEKIGVDVMRWMYCRQNPAENLLFGYKLADETRRKFHLKLWNIYNYFVTYANLDGWKPEKSYSNQPVPGENPLDSWLLSRFKETLDSATESLDAFDAYTASSQIEKYVDDFSNWYIRRSRDRTGSTSDSKTDRNRFYNTTYFCLTNLVKLLAPFTPYISEIIFQNLTKKLSVHIEDWPEYSLKIDKNLIAEMQIIRDAAEIVHSERKINKMPVRQPLTSVDIYNPLPKPAKNVLDIFLSEVNIKKVDWKKAPSLKAKLNLKLTPELKEEADSRDLIRKIQEARKVMGIDLNEQINVYNSWLPQSTQLLAKIKKVTLAHSLSKGEFSVQKI